MGTSGLAITLLIIVALVYTIVTEAALIVGAVGGFIYYLFTGEKKEAKEKGKKEEE